MSSNVNPTSAQPLASLDEWEDFLKDKYPEPAPAPARSKPAVGVAPDKQKEEFRVYEAEARPTVREFYRLNHTHQTHDFAVRTEGQTARRRERDKADDDERKAGHRPLAHAPTAQIVTPPTQHQREIALQFRDQDEPRV